MKDKNSEKDDKNMKDLSNYWTLELNIGKDPLDICSWHVDEYKRTVRKNLQAGIAREDCSPWALIAIAPTVEEAQAAGAECRELIAKILKAKKELLAKVSSGSNKES